MLLCSIELSGRPCVGVKTDSGIVNITALGFSPYINDIITAGNEMTRRISDAMQKLSPSTLREDSLKFLPVSNPKKILCEGLNYKKHAEETGGAAPEYPVFFSKFNDALSAHKQPLPLPPWLKCYDYEAELVIIVGRHAYNVTADEAEACIFGYTCGNDFSARDSQFLSSQWLAGKSLPGSAPVGPYIVTRDSFDPDKSNGVFCEVNGETVQAGDTSDMIFSCRKALSEASKYFPLNPGDMLFTGTPAGVIQGRKKEDRIWLQPGDVINVRIGGIGTLTTPLVAL